MGKSIRQSLYFRGFFHALEKAKNTLALGKLWTKLHGNICYWLLFVVTRWKFAHDLPMIWMLVIFCKN